MSGNTPPPGISYAFGGDDTPDLRNYLDPVPSPAIHVTTVRRPPEPGQKAKVASANPRSEGSTAVLTGSPIQRNEEVDWTGEKTAAPSVPVHPAGPVAGGIRPLPQQGSLNSHLQGQRTSMLQEGGEKVLQGQSPIAPGDVLNSLARRQEQIRRDTASPLAVNKLKAVMPGQVPSNLVSEIQPISALDIKRAQEVIKSAQDLGMDFSGYLQQNPFDDPHIDPVYLDLLLLKSWGNWFPWLPTTIRAELHMTFGVTPTKRLMDLILALQTVHVSEKPYTEWETFIRVCAALNHQDVSFHEMPALSPAEAAYTVALMRKIRKHGFGREVVLFLAGLCLEHQLLVPPPTLEFIYPEMLKRYQKSHPEMVAEAEKVRDAISKDFGPVWHDTVVDEQLRRLRAMESYVQIKMGGRPSDES